MKVSSLYVNKPFRFASVKITLIGILLVLLFALPMHANTDPVGSGAILRSGIDARAMGMGGAFVAIADNYAATYWNPAGVTRARSVYLGGMNQDKFGLGLNLNYLSGGLSLTNLPLKDALSLPTISIPYVNNLVIAGTYNSFSTKVRAADSDGDPIGEITYSENLYMGNGDHGIIRTCSRRDRSDRQELQLLCTKRGSER